MKKLVLLLSLVFAFASGSFAQEMKPFDGSKLPPTAEKPEAFVYDGWKVEEVVRGDLNGDGRTDAAVKLAQIDKNSESGIGGDRALVIVFDDGTKWKHVAMSDSILQCVECGGAFYGVMPAPAGVTIEKGVIVVENEHGSRNVDTSTYRFRFNKASGRFLLIGYDFADNDRGAGDWVKESTNYSTNKRVTEKGKGDRSRTKTVVIKPTKIYLEDADQDELEGEALHRNGLD